ncbi:hypothetical protein BXY41_106186 [Lacrimispora xylanisolvens]|uniref:Uncharacterized protein n=1 Tax=Lacrimispora xylanisolvens TaxID=384636 RepID=A0A2S6HSD6_9FIRM|nr:hypothetical protein [Hungatella xylanolytica]PPK80596.1 hypothetical protein BXY41_106186 [Hungatella xylanolytica]
MGKKSIVIEIMEKRLSPYGFHYAGYEGYRWRFSREVEGVIQSIVIQRSYAANDYTLEIDAGFRFCRSKEITNDPKCNLDFLGFNNEQEQRDVLNKLLDVAEKYGMNKLTELTKEAKTKPDPIELPEPTIQMYEKLYKDNSALTQQFISKIMVDGPIRETDILLLLKKELKELQGKTYESVQDKLVEFASVYGNMLINKLGGRWKYNKRIAKTGLDITLCRWINVLEVFIEAWHKGKDDLIIEEYNYRCSRVIPWVTNCRQLYGEDWQPPSTSAEWEIPPM